MSPVVAQVHSALRRKNLLPTIVGALFAGGVPVASYQTAHHDVEANPWLWVAVAGCLLFSSITVFRWASLAFQSGAKALGYVVILEVVMTFSPTWWLSAGALAILVVINAIATGATLALGEAS